jgi:hypothetical protein
MAVSGVGAVPLTADPLQADPNSFGAAMQQEIAAAGNEPTLPAPESQAAPAPAPAEAAPTPQAPAAEQAPAAPAAPTFKFADLQAWNSSEQGRAARASLLQSMPNATEQDRELAARMMFLETNGQQLDAANTNALAQNTSQMVGGQADQLWMAQAQAFGGRYLPEEVMARMASQQAQPPASEGPQSSDASVDPSLQASTAGVQAPASADPAAGGSDAAALEAALREQYELVNDGQPVTPEALQAALKKLNPETPDNLGQQVVEGVDGTVQGSAQDGALDFPEYGKVSSTLTQNAIIQLMQNPELQAKINEEIARSLRVTVDDITPEKLNANAALKAQYDAAMGQFVTQFMLQGTQRDNQTLRQ